MLKQFGKICATAAMITVSGAAVAFAQDVLKPVKLMVVSEAPVAFERQFFGQVKARQSVDLAFQVGGQIVDFPVTEGLNIGEGDVIARLDLEIFELQLNQAILQKAVSQVQPPWPGTGPAHPPGSYQHLGPSGPIPANRGKCQK